MTDSTRSFGLALVVVELMCLVSGACSPGASGPSVLLVTFDTVRADHFGCYGDDQAHTPATDGLAHEGTLFENCYSPVPLTLPAHASVLTGRYPYHHGVRDNSMYSLARSELTLAEIFIDNGFHTAAFVSAEVLSARRGLDQGFEVYDDRLPSRAMEWSHERRAADTASAALRWLRRNSSKRFFLWVHFFDPHQKYDPPAPWNELFPHDPYSGEIAYADAGLDSILREVNLENCMVVVAGDHGESLGEHGETSHGFFTYTSTLRVPLIIRYPGGFGSGKRIEEPISLVDVAPTVLSFFGYQPGEVDFDGRDLSQRTESSLPSRKIYFESFYPLNFGWSPLAGVRTREWHFVQLPTPELYRIVDDPAEEQNVFDRNLAVGKELASYLESVGAFENIGDRADSSTTADEQEMLLALGYANAGTPVVPKNLSQLPDPKAMLDCYNRYLSVEALGRLGSPTEALAVYPELSEACLAAYPVRRLQALQLREAGRLEEAIDALERCRSERPGDLLVWTTLAKSLIVSGAPGRAVELCARGLERFEDEPALWAEKGTAHRLLGELDLAASCGRRAVELDPGDADSLASLGAILYARREFDEAVEILRRAVDADPEMSFARFNLGRALVEVGEYEGAGEAFEKVVADEDSEEARLQLVKMQLVLGEPEAALAGIERLIANRPDDPSLYFLKGEAHRQIGEPVEAEQAYRIFVEVEPGHATAVLHLIDVLLEQSPPQLDQAREIARTATARGVELPRRIVRRLDLE